MKKLFTMLLSLYAILTHAQTAASAPYPGITATNGFAVSDGKLLQLLPPVTVVPPPVMVQPPPIVTPVPPVPVRLRGFNKNHWDVTSPNIADTGANAIRLVINFNLPEAQNWGYVQKYALDTHLVPIVGNWEGTCKSDVATLDTIVDKWVAQAGTWKKLNNVGLVNIANEWGTYSQIATYVPGKGTTYPPIYGWRDGYVGNDIVAADGVTVTGHRDGAIQRMRAAGYTGTLVIDAGSCGQDARTVYRDGPALVAADPLHNLLFDVHVYGGFAHPATASWMTDFDTEMGKLKASGLPIILGEFGPGLNVGPSPTMISSDTVIDLAEANGWGWLAWALDDGSCTAAANNGAKGFDMSQTCYGDATHRGDDNYTPFGLSIVHRLRALNYPAPVAPAPVLSLTTPLPLHCRPSYSCSMQLAATSTTGKAVTFSAAVLPTGVSLSAAGIFAWYNTPIAGTYPITLTLKDAAGNVSTVPVTLNVSW